MKKKIINGILLVAMLFATTSAFVSCKDTDADYKSETDAKISDLEKKLASLQTLVNSIKSCDCDSYTKAQIDQKVADLNAAINAVKNSIPSVDGFVKTADLDAKVQALLADYYTKAQVDAAIAKALEGYAKTGDVPAAGLTADQVNALIVAALSDYAKKADIPAAGLSKAEVENLISDAIQKALADYAKKTDIPTIPATLTQEDVQKLIDAAIAKINIPEGGLSKADVQKLIDDALAAFKAQLPTSLTKQEIVTIINETIQNMEIDLTTVYKTEVTSIVVDQVMNPMFSFISPFGVESNLLFTYFGEKARRNVYFPKGAEEPIIYKGEYFVEGTGNAGKLYVTVNPSSVDFSGKTLKLTTTGGDESPVELTPLQASNHNLMFLTRGDNAFYETFATIPQEKLAKAYVSWEPQDMEAFKEQIKTLLKERDKVEIAEMLKTLYNLIIDNDVPAYRLQASWGDNMFTYSKANIAAVAIKPFSYAFDLADEAEYQAEAITALEKLENHVVVWGTKSESAQKKIWRFLNKFNIGAEKVLNNINWAIQPTLLVSTEAEVSHPDVLQNNNFTRYNPGEVKLLPTSWSAEILAPAFKKYVAVISVDGTPVGADDAVNAGLLGKVIPGSVKEIPFFIEAGKTYKIQYSAVDYEGNIRTLYYVIRGNKN